MGLVSQVFDEQNLSGLHGDAAIAHTRYSTTGSTRWDNAQPLIHHGAARTIALGHNGNLTNAAELRAQLADEGVKLSSTSDSELIAALVTRDSAPLDEAVAGAMARLEGAYSIVALSEGTLLAFRDPFGFRPLALGRLDGQWVVASETCALDLVGAAFEREVAPGELVLVDADGLRSIQAVEPAEHGALCIFEFFYLARPDTRLEGVEVHGARVRMGERLAAEAPVDADLVLPIPDSGTPAAIGFSRATGIPFSEGLIKNRYVGRTFIQPEQGLREQGDQAEVQPAGRGRRQARRRRRRLDRPREHDAADRPDALRRRRDRGSRARLGAACDRSSASTASTSPTRGADRVGPEASRRFASTSARPRSRTSRSRASSSRPSGRPRSSAAPA